MCDLSHIWPASAGTGILAGFSWRVACESRQIRSEDAGARRKNVEVQARNGTRRFEGREVAPCRRSRRSLGTIAERQGIQQPNRVGLQARHLPASLLSSKCSHRRARRTGSSRRDVVQVHDRAVDRARFQAKGASSRLNATRDRRASPVLSRAPRRGGMITCPMHRIMHPLSPRHLKAAAER